MRAYEAFISYRHHTLEASIAEAVSRMMEHHVIPGKKLRQKYGKKRLGELFRDKDELPFAGNLNESIKIALRSSRKFIAVLGDDYLDPDHWCVYELEYFLRYHSPDDVLVIVTNGIIPNCIPPQLKRTDEDGKPVDPFAFDLTAYTDAKEKIRTLRQERLRLLAGILDENYGEIYNRTKRRKVKRFAACGLAVLVAVGLAAWGLREVAAKKREADISALRLLEEMASSDLTAGDRLGAIGGALAAYEQYSALYPQGDTERLASIQTVLESALSFGCFEVLAPLGDAKYDSFRYFNDDRYILCSVGGQEAIILDASSGEALHSIRRERTTPDHALRSLDASPSDAYLLTGFGDYSAELVVWDFEGHEPLREVATLTVEENFVLAYFISDQEVLYARGPLMQGETAQVWDFHEGAIRQARDEENEAFTARFSESLLTGETVISPDGRLAFVSDFSGGRNVQVLSAETGRPQGELIGASIYHTMSENGRYIIAGHSSGFCAIYSGTTGAAVTIVEDFDKELYDYPAWFQNENHQPPMLQSSHFYDSGLYPATVPYLLNEPTGRFYAMVYPDSYVEIFDMEEGSQSAQGFTKHIGMISCARMSEKYLVTAGYDGKLVVWDLQAGAVLHSLNVDERIPNFTLDSTGAYALAATESGHFANVYHLASGRLLLRLTAEPEREILFDQIGFAEDGTKAVAGQTDGRMIVGELFDGMETLLKRAGEVLNAQS